MVGDQFTFDVFLSHSSNDKTIVGQIADRLRQDGLSVWFDEWMIKPGDNIPAKIEEALESSRVLVLCMSANAFGSEWAQLEIGFFRFRDPLNKDRRFIPLRLDDAPLKGSLAQFRYVDWRSTNRENEYAKLLEASRPGGKPLAGLGDASPDSSSALPAQQTHDLRIRISPTRDRRRQLAQVRILNAGPRPILIDSWFVEWRDMSRLHSLDCVRGVLPVRLQDQERTELLVDISNKPVEELKTLGVADAEGRYWRASNEDILRFIHVAKLHAPPDLEDADPEPPGEPSEIAIATCVGKGAHDGSRRLEVRFRNLGPHDLLPACARIEWKYDPPRWMPVEVGPPRVAEVGGSVSLQLDGIQRPLHPNDEAIFFIGLGDPTAQVLMAALAKDVSEKDLQVKVAASHWEWTASGDDVTAAIREFAKLVAQATQ